jgi:hypothetical protein
MDQAFGDYLKFFFSLKRHKCRAPERVLDPASMLGSVRKFRLSYPRPYGPLQDSVRVPE